MLIQTGLSTSDLIPEGDRQALMDQRDVVTALTTSAKSVISQLQPQDIEDSGSESDFSQDDIHEISEDLRNEVDCLVDTDSILQAPIPIANTHESSKVGQTIKSCEKYQHPPYLMPSREHVRRSDFDESVSASRFGEALPTPSTSHTSHGLGQKYLLQKCPHCDEVPRCKSDYKKHVQKHEKPYMCKVSGCRREGGFTTPNDLARHMKSVHKTGGSDKSYRCAAILCKSRNKVWPRLDNFKQHCSRMHKEEDQNELIARSEFSPSPLPEAGSQLVKEPHGDALIAGMSGGSKSLAGYGNPTSSMPLAPAKLQPGTSSEEVYGLDSSGSRQDEGPQGTDLPKL